MPDTAVDGEAGHLAPAAHHLALGLEYDGSSFHGWQRQRGQISVQSLLEDALSSIAASPIRVVASGRTDAGVHATAQVVGFATFASRPTDAWVRGTNSLMPPTLAVLWAEAVPADFHARFRATARRYQYVIVESARRPTILHRRVTWSRRDVDDRAMHVAAQCLVGEHDFTSFRAAACQSKTPFRCVHAIAVRRFGPFVVIDVAANAFLHHMVRNVAGALLQVGRGEHPVAWVNDVLDARRREASGPTAPPDGLYLVEVRYGAGYRFPQALRPPPMLGALGDIW